MREGDEKGALKPATGSVYRYAINEHANNIVRFFSWGISKPVFLLIVSVVVLWALGTIWLHIQAGRECLNVKHTVDTVEQQGAGWRVVKIERKSTLTGENCVVEVQRE